MQLDLFFLASPVIQIHLTAALLAFFSGVPLLFLPKGNRLHQVLGVLAASGLAVTALSAVFIRHINDGWPSFIHLFVPLTVFSLFGLVMGLRQRNFKRHKNAGRGLILGALLIPGAIALMPGRLLHYMVFGGYVPT